MKKKSIVCGVLASSVALAATFGGCSLISSNPAADMNQTVAVVDISKAAAFDKELASYSQAVGSTSVIKREMVTYFINYYYTYVQNYGYTYEQTFNLILDSLVENAVLVQYSTVYLLQDKATNKDSVLGYDADAVSKFEAKETEAEKYEYLLGEDSDEVKIAEYNLRSSINSAIDSREKEILDKDTSSAGTDTRTAPTGVDTQKEDYYPDKDGKLNYGIYTGYKTEGGYDYTLANSGAYAKDKLEGTTNATRKQAYNEFISSLASSSYELVDKKTENLRDVRSLKYIQDEYVSQLEQRVINKYYDLYEDELDKQLKGYKKTTDGVTEEETVSYSYDLIKSIYQDKLGSQTESYETESNFSSAVDGMSDTSFVLYAPDSDNGGKYGFVYNILLPFSDAQNDALKAYQSLYADSELDGGYKPEYFVKRNGLLNEIKTTDQRAAWFNGEKEYAFNADGNDAIKYYDNGKNSTWLFFENNISSPDKYEPLDKYAGLYPYNGNVIEKDDDYLLIPNKLSINDMLDEFVAYIDKVMGNGKGTTTYNLTSGYGDAIKNDGNNLYKADTVNGKKVIDYSNFIYATGKVDFGSNKTEAYNRANLLYKDSAQYKALSAVNELQYAYTTDTGVLSKYLGYTVQAEDTSYIKEFEYAAQQAINGDTAKGIEGGAGSYVVCAGDYGWHLIYVTYTFDAGNQYTPDWAANIDKEGTFENMFYEWYKSTTLSDITAKRKNQIITDFNVTDTVTKYESAYKNLLELDSKN